MGTLPANVIELLERLKPHQEDADVLFFSEAEALARISQPGREFYETLRSCYPEIAAKAVFFSLARQPEDTWMVFDLGSRTFGVQVDPAAEVIVLFNGEFRQEFGCWHHDIVSALVAAIGERYLRSNENVEDKWRPLW